MAGTAVDGVNGSALAVVAAATVNGRHVVEPAVPADDMMQACAYHHLARLG